MSKRRRIEGSQLEWVKELLLSGKKLNHVNLIQYCGGKAGWRLGAIIHLLCKMGWPILRHYQGTRRMATYWLDPRFKPGNRQLGLPI
jgi:hypothetical protein